MATSPIQEIISGQLATGATLLYTASSVWVQITKLTVVNNDSSNRTVTFHLVPSGGAAANANRTTIAWPILAGDTWNSPNEYGLVLNPGDSLWGLADAGAMVSVFGSAILLTG